MPKKAPEWLSDDIQEFYDPNNVNIRAIQHSIQEKRGVDIAYMTITDRMKRLGLERPKDKLKQTKPSPAPQESPLPDDVVEVLPGQMEIEDADTVPEVHYGAVNEFDALPEGYAKVIQPMREYTESEDEALKESVRLFGFIGTIVRDQYGRILDGNQRSRVARWFGKGCPFTITHVKDDAHALEIANQLNLARRHFTPEQRQQIAASLREQGRSYRYIADALHVSHTQARADVMEAESKVETHFTPEPPVTTEAPESVNIDDVETYFTPESVNHHEVPEPPTPEKRVKGRDDKSYPAQRSKAPQTAHTPVVDLDDRIPKIRDMVRESLSICRTGGQIRALSSVLVRCARMLEDRAKQLQVLPYNSTTILPTLITDKSLSDQEPSETPADEVQGTDETGTCFECGRELTVEDAAICEHCGEMFHGPCLESHMEQVNDAPADADE